MRYATIYADPPWQFSTYSAKGKGRSAEAWYDCMSLSEIKKLPVGDMALPDSVLLLWTTDPFLPHALSVIAEWGFIYKTVGFYWVKRTYHPLSERCVYPIGTGYWTRANPEQCLLATRGHPKRIAANVPKLLLAPRREHSQKPDEIYSRIQSLCGGPYLELFARQRRDGWDAWGFEKDSGIATTRRWHADARELRNDT